MVSIFISLRQKQSQSRDEVISISFMLMDRIEKNLLDANQAEDDTVREFFIIKLFNTIETILYVNYENKINPIVFKNIENVIIETLAAMDLSPTHGEIFKKNIIAEENFFSINRFYTDNKSKIEERKISWHLS